MRYVSLLYFVISAVLAAAGAVVLVLNFYIALFALDPANDAPNLRAGLILFAGSAAIILAPASFFFAARRLRREAGGVWIALPWLSLIIYPALMKILT